MGNESKSPLSSAYDESRKPTQHLLSTGSATLGCGAVLQLCYNGAGMNARMEEVRQRLRSIPAAAWVGIFLVTTGALLDVPYHLVPQSVLSGLANSWGLAPDDFIFVISQVGEIGHFLLFGGLFFIAVAVISIRLTEEERCQHHLETQESRPHLSK